MLILSAYRRLLEGAKKLCTPASIDTLKTIVVSCGCQTSGLVAALSAIFPQCSVTPCPLPVAFDDAQQERVFARQLLGNDIWISSAHAGLPEKYWPDLPGSCPRTVLAPVLGFSAFHPDICYAVQKSTGVLTDHHYNSAICLWAYRNRVLPEDAQRLYTAGVYRDLGYLNLWGVNVAALRHAFAQCQLEHYFNPFFLHLQRTGNFMHSVNHPKPHALVRLAKVIALRLGAEPAVLERHVEVEDFLSQAIWPMYPEVASSLSLPGGSYRWKINSEISVEGTRDYIDFSYAAYKRQGIEPQDIGTYNREDVLFDTVLGAALGCKS